MKTLTEMALLCDQLAVKLYDRPLSRERLVDVATVLACLPYYLGPVLYDESTRSTDGSEIDAALNGLEELQAFARWAAAQAGNTPDEEMHRRTVQTHRAAVGLIDRLELLRSAETVREHGISTWNGVERRRGPDRRTASAIDSPTAVAVERRGVADRRSSPIRTARPRLT